MGTNCRVRGTLCVGLAASAALIGSTQGIAAPAGPQRLAWTQPSSSAGLRYKIFIDGEAATLGEVSCVAAADGTDCSAPLPDIAPGTHTVEISVADGFGHESVRSQSLTVTIAAPGPSQSSPATLAAAAALASASSSAPADAGSRPQAIPARACAGPGCYNVSLMARGQGSITRLEALGDDAVLMLRDGTDVLVLRSGQVTIAYQLRRDDPRSSAIADIAVDPDFARNQFVYLAVVTTSPQGSSVRLVRAREVGDRLAEIATIVPDFPIGHEVSPRLAVSADRHLYLAIPVATDGSARQPYDGSIVAFTDDGRSAGASVGSPVLARGPEQPATIERGGAALIWLGASDAIGEPQLLRLSGDGTLASSRPMEVGLALSGPAAGTGILDVAFSRPDRGVLITASPRELFEFRLSPDAASFARERIDLGGFEPTAVTTTTGGDMVVAVRDAADPQSVAVLSLRSASVWPR